MQFSASGFARLLHRPLDAAGHHAVGVWVAALVILMLFGVMDVAIVARSVDFGSVAELAAGVFVFTLAVAGLVITVWEMEENGRGIGRRR